MQTPNPIQRIDPVRVNAFLAIESRGYLRSYKHDAERYEDPDSEKFGGQVDAILYFASLAEDDKLHFPRYGIIYSYAKSLRPNSEKLQIALGSVEDGDLAAKAYFLGVINKYVRGGRPIVPFTLTSGSYDNKLGKEYTPMLGKLAFSDTIDIVASPPDYHQEPANR